MEKIVRRALVSLIMGVAPMLTIERVAVAADRLVAAEVVTSRPEVKLYGSREGGAAGALRAAEFPKKVIYLEDGQNGRLRIRLPDSGQEVWIRRQDVRLDLPEHVRKAECEPHVKNPNGALAPAPTRGGRGLGEGCAR
ncbi:MAG: hypothetical protein GC202_10165 [Alphaproteobacteria bacterium]|nr:hypothetical protein [Alphaproteobacteria bacterium]